MKRRAIVVTSVSSECITMKVNPFSAACRTYSYRRVSASSSSATNSNTSVEPCECKQNTCHLVLHRLVSMF